MERVYAEGADTLLLLGDILYHGPRNPLPERYAPQEVAECLNAFAPHIVAVQGNCDAEVDQWLLNFPLMNLSQQIIDEENGVTIFATHGHRDRMNPAHPEELLPLPEKCVFASGHVHLKVLEEHDGVVFANPGSAALPKDDGPGYVIYEHSCVTLKTLDGKEISHINL